jgi:hypothetical protein
MLHIDKDRPLIVVQSYINLAGGKDIPPKHQNLPHGCCHGHHGSWIRNDGFRQQSGLQVDWIL